MEKMIDKIMEIVAKNVPNEEDQEYISECLAWMKAEVESSDTARRVLEDSVRETLPDETVNKVFIAATKQMMAEVKSKMDKMIDDAIAEEGFKMIIGGLD